MGVKEWNILQDAFWTFIENIYFLHAVVYYDNIQINWISAYMYMSLQEFGILTNTGQLMIDCLRFKGKSRMMPTVPNQPSEAIAHFMFELSKTVLGKAGGNSSTSLFTQPTSTNTTTGPHRNLHLCAFQIGVYALGLNNCVSPNWLSRTYSSHVSWITG